MPTPTSLANLQDDLKRVQAEVKQLDGHRERLSGLARVEEHKLKEALGTLKALRIENADKLSPQALLELCDQKQASLEADLAVVKQNIQDGFRAVAKYDKEGSSEA